MPNTITLPYDIDNGDPLDADQVMANENAIVSEYNSEVASKAGSVVTTAETQTLTNKTLTAPTVTSPAVSGTVSGGATYTKPVLAASVQSVTTDADGATVTFNLATSNVHQVTLGGNRTLAVSNAVAGQYFAIELIQDATGSRTVTWFSTIKWVGGTTPTLTTTANKKDSFMFRCTGTGTYDGYIVGQNI